jgi:hypothetical protein
LAGNALWNAVDLRLQACKIEPILCDACAQFSHHLTGRVAH